MSMRAYRQLRTTSMTVDDSLHCSSRRGITLARLRWLDLPSQDLLPGLFGSRLKSLR